MTCGNLPPGVLQESFDVQHWIALSSRCLPDGKQLNMPDISPVCLESEEQLHVVPREAPSVLMSRQKHYRKYLFEFKGQFISWGRELWRTGGNPNAISSSNTGQGYANTSWLS